MTSPEPILSSRADSVTLYPISEQDEAMTPLSRAVARFNEVFGYGIRLPVDAATVESMAYIADRRGRADLGKQLRFGLKPDSTV